ncbi:MAG: oligosaccharide flippase family protein [Candidatus Eisenbacteria bacterium]
MSPQRFVRDSIGLAAAQFAVRAMIIARTVIAARLLGPQVFGAWNALQLLMDYGALAPLGTQQGLDQLVPRRIVDGDAGAGARLKRAGLTSVLILSLLYASACVAYFLGSSGNLMSFWGIAGLLVAMAIVVQINWASYSTGVLRSHGNIGAVSRWFFLQGMIGALLGLLLIRWFGGWGLLWGWFAGTAIAFVWTQWEARRVAPFRPLISAESVELFRVGFPMFFFAGAALIVRNLDRLIILRYLGTKELGYYSLAVTAMTLVMYLPDSATFVFYPRLIQRFRENGDRPEAVQAPVLTVLRVLTVVTPALGGVAYFFVRDMVAVLLPNFFLGAPAVQVMCFTGAALCITNLAAIVLMTLGRQLWLIPMALISIVAFAVADVLALRSGHGITGVAWATLIAYTATGAVTLALALTALRLPISAVARRVLASLWGLAVAVALAPLTDRFAPWANGGSALPRILHAVVGSATFLVAYALLVGPQLRGLGIRQIVSELNLPFAGLFGRPGNGGGTAP